MSEDYVDFDVTIEHAEQGYAVRVDTLGASDSAADAPVTAPFVLPFAPTELAAFMVAVGPPRAATRRLVPAAARVTDVKDYGGRLGDALFSGSVGAAFRRRLDEARAHGRDVRVRLRLETVPELEAVPWEYLYSAGLGRFLTLSTRTPVVRLLDALDPPPPVTVQAPLRVLVMISSPSDMPELAVEREEQLLRATTSDLVAAGRLELVVLDRATLPALQRALLEPFHVFHFIGHGGWDRETEQGVLVLEREDRTSHRVSGARLGTLLHDARELQLAVLNACEGARSSGRDAFSGVGQALVRQGLPAVVAMQTEISDRAALVFSHEFYSFLTRGLPIDAAICEVRKAMAVSDEASEWGTAVLLRSGGGQPFSFAPQAVQATSPETRWQSLYDVAQGALASDAPQTAVPMLEQLAAERPDYADVTALLERVRPGGAAAVGAVGGGGVEAGTSAHVPANESATDGEAAPPGAAPTVTNAPATSPLAPPANVRDVVDLLVTADAAGRQRARRLVIGAGIGFAVVTAVAVGLGTRITDTPGTSASPSPSATASSATTPGAGPTPAAMRTVDLPVSGTPSGQLVLPYAVGGDYISAAGSSQIGPWGDLIDVLRLPNGNRVVTVSQAGNVRMSLTDTGGESLVDLGGFRSRVEANRGTRFAYVDRGDGHLSVRDVEGTEVAALPDVGPEAEVVGFAGSAVFFTDNGSTFRWDTTTQRAAEWRQTEMVVFNDTTRTAVGSSAGGCFAVLKVGTPSQATRNLDCRGLDVQGLTGDGRYAIAWSTPTGPEASEVLLVDTSTGRPAFAVRVPAGSIVVQAGYRTSPVPRTFELSTVTADGSNRLVGCPTDGTCSVLTEPRPTAGDPLAPPPYVISRD
ncbi:CHAT domain-containing protein [Terrabacter sp. LjRoot27]|uniref:CHAT domain-containing protein n=1 Tax=Terrabacter sp. LjRoot27 TaxID=3342306 RepID=UPI003ECDE7A4